MGAPQEDFEFVSDERRSERAGRIKAEVALRELQLRTSQLSVQDGRILAPVDLLQVSWRVKVAISPLSCNETPEYMPVSNPKACQKMCGGPSG